MTIHHLDLEQLLAFLCLLLDHTVRWLNDQVFKRQPRIVHQSLILYLYHRRFLVFILPFLLFHRLRSWNLLLLIPFILLHIPYNLKSINLLLPSPIHPHPLNNGRLSPALNPTPLTHIIIMLLLFLFAHPLCANSSHGSFEFFD